MPRMLGVDDEPTIAKLLRMTLEIYGLLSRGHAITDALRHRLEALAAQAQLPGSVRVFVPACSG